MSQIDSVLQALITDSSNTVAKRLIALNNICQEQYERGSTDFTIATIGRIAESEGLIKSQSIRNQTGEKYRTLITAWAEEFSSKSLRKDKSNSDWIDRIDDPQVKWLVRDQAVELARLRREISALKSMDRYIHVGAAPTSGEHVPENIDGMMKKLLPAEWDAILESIKEERLHQLGLIVGGLGEIKNDKGINIMPHGFVTAIKKLLALDADKDY